MDDSENLNQWDGSVERRSGHDRRQRNRPSLKDMLIYRRRRRPRRKEDRSKFVLLDHYGTSIGLSFITVLILSVVDAFMTLFLLSHGAVEMNPVMGYFLEINEYAFLSAKYGLTVVSVFIILILNYAFMQKFRLHAQSLLNCFVLIFALLVFWEIYLVMRHVI